MGEPCPTPDDLLRFRTGDLTDDLFESVARHVESCAACLAVLDNTAPPDDPLQAAVRDPASADPFIQEPQCQGAVTRYAAALWETAPLASGSQEDLPSTKFHPRPEEAASTPHAGPEASSIPDAQKSTVACSGPAPAAKLPNLGRYQNLGEIRRGGMGVIYRARNPVLEHVVALKMIRSGSLAGPEDFERFLGEAKKVARLKHRNIIKIFDYGEIDEQPYFTMELADLGSLQDHLARFQQDPRGSVRLLAKVARAVHHVHEHGIVHRDLKPGNILLDAGDEPLVSDFGLAKSKETDRDLTQPGVAPGTWAYMAPEQFAKPDDPPHFHSDIWSLGVILYEVLLGKAPFSGRTWDEYSRTIRLTDPPRPRSLKRRLHRDLETIILTCLEKNPARRYASAAALADDMERWLGGEPILARPLPGVVRLARWVRRHKILSTSVLFLLCLPLGFFLVRHFSDPERPLRKLQRILDREGRLSILSQDGELEWYEWRTRKSEFKSLGKNLRGIRFDAFNLGLLEVFRDPPEKGFEFKAKIRHDQSELGLAGLFFGLKTLGTQEGPVLFFGSLGFNDLDEIVSPKLPGGPKPNPLGLRLHLYREANEASFIPALGPVFLRAGEFGSFFPAKQSSDTGPWRELTILANEQAIHWRFGGAAPEVHGKLERVRFFETTSRLFADNCKELRAQSIEFPPRGGMGLLVECGQASFKDIEISHRRD
jgi:serine/threonine-protein kinase